MRIFLLLLCTVVSLSAQSVSPIVAASKAGDASATKKNVLAYMRLVRTEARSADDSDAALALYHTGNALRPFDEINSEILLTEAFDRAMKVGPLSATAVTVASTRNDRFAAAYQDTLAEKSQLPLLIISNLASLNLKKAKDLFASLPDNLTGYKIVTYGDISVRYAANKSFTDVIVELCSSMYKSRPEAATEFFESGMRNYNDPSFTSALKYLNLLNSTGDPNEDAAMQSVHEKAIRLMETDNYIAAHLAYSGFLLQARSAIVGNELPGIAKLFENIDTAKLQREEARLLADAANNYWLAAQRSELPEEFTRLLQEKRNRLLERAEVSLSEFNAGQLKPKDARNAAKFVAWMATHNKEFASKMETDFRFYKLRARKDLTANDLQTLLDSSDLYGKLGIFSLLAQKSSPSDIDKYFRQLRDSLLAVSDVYKRLELQAYLYSLINRQNDSLASTVLTDCMESIRLLASDAVSDKGKEAYLGNIVSSLASSISVVSLNKAVSYVGDLPTVNLRIVALSSCVEEAARTLPQ